MPGIIEQCIRVCCILLTSRRCSVNTAVIKSLGRSSEGVHLYFSIQHNRPSFNSNLRRICRTVRFYCSSHDNTPTNRQTDQRGVVKDSSLLKPRSCSRLPNTVAADRSFIAK